jgi:hypothetical protein
MIFKNTKAFSSFSVNDLEEARFKDPAGNFLSILENDS